MSEKIQSSVTPETMTATIGEPVEVNATLKNLGQSIDQFTISIDGLDPEWYTLPVSSVALFPNDEDTLKIVIAAPDKPGTEVGTYPFSIRVVSQANPDDFATTDLSMTLSAIPQLEVSITPQQITGRRGVYQLLFNNPNGKDAYISLEASDEQGALRYYLKPEEMIVLAGRQDQASLEVNLGWMSFLGGEKTFNFQVEVRTPDAAKGEIVSAQLVRVPWYRIFSKVRLPGGKSGDAKLANLSWFQSIRRIRLPNIHLPWLEKPPQINAFKAATDDRIDYKLSWSVKRAKNVKLNDEIVDREGFQDLQPTAATTYVLTASNKYGTVNKTVEVQPREIPEAKTSDLIRASLSSANMKLQAGGIPETVTVQIQNLAEIVDKMSVEVVGLDEDWYSRSASSIALMPQATDNVQLTFSPPKKRGVKAREYPFAIAVRSQSKPEEATIIHGCIDVLPLVEYKLKIAPYRITTRSKGKFRVNLANTGMSDAKVYLEATDLDEGLQFKFGNEEPMASAWETIEVPMTVKLKKGSKVGERKRFDITVTATGEDGVAQTANCELHHKPFMASYRPVWRIIKTLLILGIIGVAIYYILRLGGGLNTLMDSPQTWVDNLVNKVEGWFFR